MYANMQVQEELTTLEGPGLRRSKKREHVGVLRLDIRPSLSEPLPQVRSTGLRAPCQVSHAEVASGEARIF